MARKKLKDDDVIKFEFSTYQNIQEIGKGGFGIVYSTYRDGKRYALKTFKNDDANKEVTKDFIKELKQLHAITFHPNINKFYGITRGITIMESTAIFRKKGLNHTFEISLNEIIQISKQITDGLDHLHKNNIIHCDLHSKNILINDDKFLIADFGLSRKIDDTYNSSASIIKGMPAYLDPYCHCEPGKKLDQKSDIYSLGVIFWELTSGIPPFASAFNGIITLVYALAGFREQVIPGTPIGYEKLYRKCWNTEPEERSTINKILEDLNSISKRENTIYT
ncbi:10572_t:CDS:2, partial [Dentiscutata heterogama]